MNTLSPVYSINAQCRDCYKCVRQCPVKAIHVENDHAVVSPKDCVYCGKCVSICKYHAKVVRDDLTAIRLLIGSGTVVYASMAPSFASEFPGVTGGQLSTALKRLGFKAMYETAEGANIVSCAVAELIAKSPTHRLQISSACPVVVELIQHYYAKFTPYITPVDSPIIAHCKKLHQELGNHVPIIFFGPCVGKKHESDLDTNQLHAVLTFEELRRWFMLVGIDSLRDLPEDPDYKLPGDGAYYPIEGGMVRSVMRNIHAIAPNNKVVPMTLSGIKPICQMLESLDPHTLNHPLFIEALACTGGCVCGPKSQTQCAASGLIDVMKHASQTDADDPIDRPNVGRHYRSKASISMTFTEEKITTVLHELGKYQAEDELNCEGCGYDSCRELACAILSGHAEPQMCVSHMRQLAQKKSSAIDRALPYGLVVVDSELMIQECNERFAKLLGEEMTFAYEIKPGLRGLDLVRVLPYPNLFNSVLRTGEEILRKTIDVNGRLFSLTVFNVEPHVSIGALILDVTESEQRRRLLIEKARMVVQNTSKTVQEIAFMLGRNAAQSEVILNSAVEMFAPLDQEEDHKGDVQS